MFCVERIQSKLFVFCMYVYKKNLKIIVRDDIYRYILRLNIYFPNSVYNTMHINRSKIIFKINTLEDPLKFKIP